VTLTKAAIVNELAFRNMREKEDAQDIAEVLIEIIKRTLESGEDVMISGFGKFAVKHKAARQGRNPATGEPMTLRPRRIIAFYCADKLKQRVNGQPLF